MDSHTAGLSCLPAANGIVVRSAVGRLRPAMLAATALLCLNVVLRPAVFARPHFGGHGERHVDGFSLLSRQLNISERRSESDREIGVTEQFDDLVDGVDPATVLRGHGDRHAFRLARADPP